MNGQSLRHSPWFLSPRREISVLGVQFPSLDSFLPLMFSPVKWSARELGVFVLFPPPPLGYLHLYQNPSPRVKFSPHGNDMWPMWKPPTGGSSGHQVVYIGPGSECVDSLTGASMALSS